MKGFSLDDTIAAIATPLGEGGVGIVKISGPEAPAILGQLFVPALRKADKLEARRLTFGHIRDPQTGDVVDEVLAVYMPAPHSYTRQDVVEIQAHGGIVPLRRILGLTLMAGARPAEPGEMTLRAFINGRLDLAQAEAVLDVVQARTEAALRVATEQLGGRLSAQVREARARLVDVLAYLEASIDFVEDEIPPQDVVPPLREIATEIQGMLATADRGLIYRQGIRAAIVGRPNVGKSSLLNALLRGERAIVTPIPGTTRDTLEEAVNLQGVPLVLVDTAGIRAETSDEVERIGVARSRAALERADLALLVIDGSQPMTDIDWDIAALIGHKPALVVVNKCDLPQLELPDNLLPAVTRIRVSALTGEGIQTLEDMLVELVFGGTVTAADTPLVSNPRHQASLKRALDHVQAAEGGHLGGLSPDLVAIDVREAVDALGEITGETASEDLLEAIFSNFCIGK
ncbi:MAG: tRNA uridine-5-carboxymethylaminomethyl(34) synthesis GTPase MnmE [Anaerolineae bacterium]